MKQRTTTSILLALLALTGASCGDGEVKAGDVIDSGKNALEGLQDLDLDSLGVDGMKDKVGELTASLGDKLKGIQDEAGALDASKALGPVVDQLSKLKGALGDKMPAMDELGATISSLKEKFSGDAGVMAALQPLLDKLQSLLG